MVFQINIRGISGKLQHVAFIWQMTTAWSLKMWGRAHGLDFLNFPFYLSVPFFPDICCDTTDEQQSIWTVGIMQDLGKGNKELEFT